MHYYCILIFQYSNSICIIIFIFGVVLTYGSKPIFDKKNYLFIYPRIPPPPPPLKITFYMGVQNHAGRLLETGGGSEAS